MGHQNSASPIPSTGTEDEYDPSYVAGGDPNQVPTHKVPAWKSYLNQMGSGAAVRSTQKPMWQGIGEGLGSMLTTALAKKRGD